MKRLFVIIFSVISLLWISCGKNARFPNFKVNSYIDGGSFYLSDLITSPKLVIWMPLNSCGVCVHETMKAIRRVKIANSALLLTIGSNSVQYNWIKLNIKKMNNEKFLFFDISKERNIDSEASRFIKNHNKVELFLLYEHLVIHNSKILGANEKEIAEKIIQFDSFVRH